MKRLFLIAFICTTFVSNATAQTNLLLNPIAKEGVENWRLRGSVSVEEFDGRKVFVVRGGCGNGIGFTQDVKLSDTDGGKFALLIGRGSSERVNEDGAITGLPYLYGYMMSSVNPRGAGINAYLQGQAMLASPLVPNEWVTMHGIFPIPKGTVAIRFFLQQAERRGVPQNGSAARFDDVGLYIFNNEYDARQFVISKSKSL